MWYAETFMRPSSGISIPAFFTLFLFAGFSVADEAPIEAPPFPAREEEASRESPVELAVNAARDKSRDGVPIDDELTPRGAPPEGAVVLPPAPPELPDDSSIFSAPPRDDPLKDSRGYRVRPRFSHRVLRWWKKERQQWSLHFYGGQNVNDTLFELFGGEVHRHSSGLASLGAVRDNGAFGGVHADKWWWPSWEVEYTLTRRLETSAFNEHNLSPLRLRWDLPTSEELDPYAEFSFALSEGLSLAERIPDVEVRSDEESHRFQNFLALDFILGLPRLKRVASFTKNMNVFFRVHHRSDFYGVYPKDGGSNTLTVGVSFGRSRTEKRRAIRIQ